MISFICGLILGTAIGMFIMLAIILKVGDE